MMSFSFSVSFIILLFNFISYTSSREYIGYLVNKGCWEDDPNDRDLSAAFKDFGDEMIPDKCFGFCSERGYRFAGLENKRSCYCDNEYLNMTKLENSECGCSCLGNSDSHCGCENKLRIFELDYVELHTKQYHGHIKYEGCYEDKADSRDLNGLAKRFLTMTPDKCFDYCHKNNFKYAGLQDGKYCFCGNEFGKYELKSNEECGCPCLGNPYKICGCEMRNRVWELKEIRKYEKPECGQRPLQCGCWGDPHCYTFDKKPFSFMGACAYDLVSTDCKGRSLPAELVPFVLIQGQETQEGFPGGSFVEFLELEVFGKKFRFLKATDTKRFVFTIDGLPAVQPYIDYNNGIKIYANCYYLIFVGKFGLKIIWSGEKQQAKVQLCDAYAGYTCGLCGNSDGIKDDANEFVDRDGNAVDVSIGGKYTRHFDWGTKWKSIIQSAHVDHNQQWCNETKPEDTPCDEPLYAHSYDWCGVLHDTTYDGPWQNCIFNMDPLAVQGFTDGCTVDLCLSESNTTLQHERLCSAYAEFNNACKELDENWHVNWRNMTGCTLECASDRVYDVRKECGKSCSDPLGTDCEYTLWVEGCFCKDGLVMDSDGHCIELEQCGCPVPDQDSILPVGDVIFSEDCSLKHKCVTERSDMVTYNYTACSPNAFCSNVNDEPVCECKPGFTGDGYECQPKELACFADYCYGFGDPHYRSEHGKLFEINNTCSYILATDSLAFSEPTFTVIVDQEKRYDSNAFFMKSVRIELMNAEFVIDKHLWVNDVKTPLPYHGQEFSIYKHGMYILFDDPRFNVAFDGGELLKVRVCVPIKYGLCHLQNDSSVTYPFANYLSEDSVCEF